MATKPNEENVSENRELMESQDQNSSSKDWDDLISIHATEQNTKHGQKSEGGLTETNGEKETNIKDKIQTVVDQFNLLDSVEKACFFHCIVPSLREDDIQNLQFSISLNRSAVDLNKKTEKKPKLKVKEATSVEVGLKTKEKPEGKFRIKSGKAKTSKFNGNQDQNDQDISTYVDKDDEIDEDNTDYESNAEEDKEEEESETAEAKNTSKPKQKIRKDRPKPDKISPNICKQCGRYSKDEAALALHMMIKHTQRLHECDQCDKCFVSEQTLKDHMTFHGVQQTFPCEQCDEAFTSRAGLTLHTGKKHRRTAKRYMCPQCPRDFAHVRNMQRHLVLHTGTPLPGGKQVGGGGDEGKGGGAGEDAAVKSGGNYVCHLCYANFAHRSALWRHQKTHTGERPHKCEQCGKAFLDKQVLVAHQRTHTGEKPFICDVCGLTFTQKSNLRSHTNQAHLGKAREKKIMCDRCPKTFKDNSALKRHYVIHTDEKAFVCSHCSKGFRRSTDLQVHERTHTGEKPFSCTVCRKSFSDSSNLKVHEKSHTPGDACPYCLLIFKNIREFRKHKKICKGEVATVQEFFQESSASIPPATLSVPQMEAAATLEDSPANVYPVMLNQIEATGMFYHY